MATKERPACIGTIYLPHPKTEGHLASAASPSIREQCFNHSGFYDIALPRYSYPRFPTPSYDLLRFCGALETPRITLGWLQNLAYIRHYNKGDGLADLDVQPLALTEPEIDDLVAFLGFPDESAIQGARRQRACTATRLAKVSRPQRDTDDTTNAPWNLHARNRASLSYGP